jgi:dipeptidyl aminopeptidase/acylaminoacyl peptidase
MTVRIRTATLSAILFAAAGAAPLAAGGGAEAAGATSTRSDLIPRQILFGNPDKSQLRISPDGKQVAFLAPKDGVMNVWVAPAAEPKNARVVTNDTKRGIRSYSWAYTSGHILYSQDKGGDENWKVFSVDLTTGKELDLTPFEEIVGADGKAIEQGGQKLRPTARIEVASDQFPDEIIIGINNRSPQWHDLFRVNIRTGQLTKLLQNDGYAGFEIDDHFRVSLASKMLPDGSTQMFRNTAADPKAIAFEPWQTVPQEDGQTTGIVAFDKTGGSVYMTDSRGRNTGALFAVPLAGGEKKLLAENARADAGGIIMHPTEDTIQAVAFNYLRNEWTILDPSLQKDMDFLKTVSSGEINIGSRSLDDSVWTVTFSDDAGPARSYIYDRAKQQARFVFANIAALDGLSLADMHPVVIKSRDGLDMVSYLTLPVGSFKEATGMTPRPQQPLPMVLVVHGGPWARDSWGYNAMHQWLANRGYAVLSVNFRASTGFGKSFLNAGNREWGAKMHDDLIDAVNWAIENRIADKDKVAIMGGSYGGYAALAGLTFTPDTFAAAISIVGPSNINTLLSTIPPYWAPMIAQFKIRMGDFTTEEGKKFLESRSPLTFVDRIKKPLLIGQGANDPRVKQAESDQIVAAMQKKNIPVTYVLYPDEGHGFARPENRLSFYAVAEAFLAEHLGGRVEPVGDDFHNSSITVPTGAEGVKGLKEALPAKTN